MASTPAAAYAADNHTKIDLDLTNVDIHDAIAELAHKAGINLGLHSEVPAGLVTIKVQAMPWDEALAIIAKQHALKVERSNISVVVSKASSPSKARVYTGAPMAVNFENTPIRAVAKAFSEHAKVPITVDHDVQVDVTQRLKKLPWDAALAHIAQKYGLRLVHSGDAIRIAHDVTATAP